MANPNYFFLLFPLFFIGFWFFITQMISKFGGWAKLATAYPMRTEFTDFKWRRWQSARLNQTRYNGALNFGSNSSGLTLIPLLIFRAGHPQIFIPWNEIAASQTKLFFLTFMQLDFSKTPGVKMLITPRLAKKLAEDSSGKFRLPN